VNELKNRVPAQRDGTIDPKRPAQAAIDPERLGAELAAISTRLTHLHDELDQAGVRFLHLRPGSPRSN
jgi:hypothetical protein